MSATALDDQATDLAAVYEQIPAEWTAPVRHVATVIGPAFDWIRATFLIRLADYAMQGYELADVCTACAALSSPEVQGRCTKGEHWLNEFAAALTTARVRRIHAERAARDRETREQQVADRAAAAARVRQIRDEIAARTMMPAEAIPAGPLGLEKYIRQNGISLPSS